MIFEKNDRVKVITKNSTYWGKVGTVVSVHEPDRTFIVRMDMNEHLSGFFVHELEPVDTKREALIELAETLDKARLQANAIKEFPIESQRGVYGQIAQSIQDTLEVLFMNQVADHSLYAARTYTLMIDGSTVRQAIAEVEG